MFRNKNAEPAPTPETEPSFSVGTSNEAYSKPEVHEIEVKNESSEFYIQVHKLMEGDADLGESLRELGEQVVDDKMTPEDAYNKALIYVALYELAGHNISEDHMLEAS